MNLIDLKITANNVKMRSTGIFSNKFREWHFENFGEYFVMKRKMEKNTINWKIYFRNVLNKLVEKSNLNEKL